LKRCSGFCFIGGKQGNLTNKMQALIIDFVESMLKQKKVANIV